MINRAASIRARLLAKAKAENQDFSLVLTRYGLERLLYRLSVSSNKDNFLLKGALLFDLWFDVPLRPTRDIDLLGFGPAEEPLVLAAFQEICLIEVDDGIEFNLGSVKIEEIRKDANYSGLRISMIGYVDGARCPIQVDIGYGDAVTPAPELAEYPVMLSDTPVPILRVYPRYTVIAEKFEALISLGMINTRLKDYFDLWVILTTTELDQKLLGEAITATFTRRKTPLPSSLPVGLSEEFSSDAKKIAQWNAFIKKNQLDAPSLDVVVTILCGRLVQFVS
ncbi:MAG: nucleotidyl transferase AbiEii/AbiGii toxin family protein [Fluviibacter sp.]